MQAILQTRIQRNGHDSPKDGVRKSQKSSHDLIIGHFVETQAKGRPVKEPVQSPHDLGAKTYRVWIVMYSVKLKTEITAVKIATR
jgi:hypothetical protein